MYKQYLALNNLHGLIYHKTQPTSLYNQCVIFYHGNIQITDATVTESTINHDKIPNC